MNSSTLSAIISGIIAATGIIHYQDAARSCLEPLRDAIDWQTQTVETAEALGLSCAKDARAQWDARRPIAERRLRNLAEFAGNGDLAPLEKTTAELQAEMEIKP